MARVIYRLWQDDNKDLMIMPGSLPLHDGERRNELIYYLPAGWDPVIERDIDGDRAETTELENKEPRFGQLNAARRVARTLFLGSAPASVATKPRNPWLGPRPCLARLSPAGPEFFHLLGRPEPLGRSAALPEQFGRQGPRYDPLLVRHARQPPPRNGGPKAAISTTPPTFATRLRRS